MPTGTASGEGVTTMGIGELGGALPPLADATEDCVFLTDRRGRYLAVNRGFALGGPPGGRNPRPNRPPIWASASCRETSRRATCSP